MLLVNKPPTTLEEIIDYICPDTSGSLSESYAAMSSPCLRDGRFLATDGHVGLSLPPELVEVEAESNPDFPNLEGKIAHTFGGESIAEVKYSTLKEALDRVPQEEAYDRETCPDCSGEGYEICPACGATHDCDSCRGKGTWKGARLGSRYSEHHTLVFCGQHYRPKYIFLALCLADILDAETLSAYHAPQGDLKILGLEIGPARLVVMPLYMHGYDTIDYAGHIEVVANNVTTA